ncbi:MAG: polyketide synthase dehydratase domain-containing protein, partial [bacterium]
MVQFRNFDKDFAHKKISLPSYPFQKQRYWIDDLNKKENDSEFNFTQSKSKSHPLLGTMIVTASDNEFIFNSRIEANDPEYLKDHLVFGKVVLPGAAYIEIAAAAFKEITDKTKFSVTDVSFRHAMVIEEGSFRNVQTILTKKENGSYEFKIFSLSDSDWTLHSSGIISDAVGDTSSAELETLKNKFSQTVSPAKVYDNAKETGVEYGNEFQAIKELFVNDNSALSRLKLIGNVNTDKYLIHPVILDAAFQTALSILIKGKEKAFIPVGAGSFNFYCDAGDEVWSLVEINEGNTNSNIHSADIKIFTKQGKVVAEISGLKLKEVSREEFTESMNNINDWFYEVRWEASDEKPALDCNVSEVYKEVKNVLPELSSVNNLLQYNYEIERIEKIALSYIISAFRNSGFDFEKQESFSADEIADKLKIIKGQKKLFNRLLNILTENGILKFSAGKFMVQNHKPEVTSDDISYTSATAELELLRRCGEHLDEVLTGKQDAIQLLFPNGDFTLAEKLYKDSPRFVVMNEAIKNAVVNILSTGNSDHKIRILEIGAGTGSTASYILPLLKNNTSYTFTDISPAFFIKAKEKFNEFDNVEYKVLDIEKDPLAQNFDAHSYDIVIASNVIHATKDLSASVKNIKSLLNKNGIMILNEVTEKKNWIDLTFGLTDGWWRFEDDSLRKNYPLLGNTEWKKFLESENLQAEVASPDSLSAQSLIIAQQRIEIDSSRSHLIIFNAGKNDQTLSNYLKTSNAEYTLINDDKSFKKITGNKFSINFNEVEDHKKLLNELELKSDNVHIVYIATDKNLIRTKSISDDSIEPCVNILNIIKNISGEPKLQGSTLSIITYGAQKVTASDTAEGLIHSPLWGMGKVISMEHPGLKCKMIDTD